MKITTKFNIDDNVKLKELNRHGRIMSIFITRSGVEYQVRYFDNAELRSVYFLDSEMEKIDMDNKVGF